MPLWRVRWVPTDSLCGTRGVQGMDMGLIHLAQLNKASLKKEPRTDIEGQLQFIKSKVILGKRNNVSVCTKAGQCNVFVK